jgi:hypothetical protein
MLPKEIDSALAIIRAHASIHREAFSDFRSAIFEASKGSRIIRDYMGVAQDEILRLTPYTGACWIGRSTLAAHCAMLGSALPKHLLAHNTASYRKAGLAAATLWVISGAQDCADAPYILDLGSRYVKDFGRVLCGYFRANSLRSQRALYAYETIGQQVVEWESLFDQYCRVPKQGWREDALKFGVEIANAHQMMKLIKARLD